MQRTRMAKCGHEIPSHPGKQRIACGPCRDAGFGQRRPDAGRMLDKTCEACGTAYRYTVPKQGPRQSQNACCKACADWLREHPGEVRALGSCAHCGEGLRKAGIKFCSRDCLAAFNRKTPEPSPEAICASPACDAVIPPNFRGRRYCTAVCGQLDWARQQRAAGRSFYRHTPGAQARWERRRARKANAAMGEPFTRTQVFERDEWRCYLCEEQVDRSLTWPHPLSPSLEHVVPLSRGGAHSFDNVRLAHLTCNVAKGARTLDELGIAS